RQEWQAACKEGGQRFSALLRLIRKHPVAGLLLALSLEAWLAIPGEAMIAVAASTIVTRACSLLRLAAGGVTGMLVNDLVLFGLSRVGRGVMAQWIHAHALHFHLSAQLVVGAKFLPPLRSAAYLVYGLQGAPFGRFLEVSLLSSVLWVAGYAILGRCFHGSIGRFMRGAEHHRGWMSLVELGLTVGMIAAVWL